MASRRFKEQVSGIVAHIFFHTEIYGIEPYFYIMAIKIIKSN